MIKALKNSWVKLLLVAVGIAAIVLILKSLNIDFSKVTVEDFKNMIDSWGAWGPVAYIIFYILRPLILFPAGVLSASAGVIWGLKGFIYLQIAANISSTAEFLIARYFARDAVSKLIKGKMQNIDEKIEKHGFLTVFLIRLIPNVAWDIQNLGLGVTKVKFRDYFLATFIGIMPGSFALVYFGSSIINVITNPKNFWMILLAIAIFAAIFFLQNFLKKRQAEKSATNTNVQEEARNE
ncbi:TVP38/TMEM64 family protein [Candidatus Omnitrophota bacterium]